MLRVKPVSNLEKVMAGGCYCDYKEISRVSVLRGERASFELVLELELMETENFSRTFIPSVKGELAEYVTLREVRHVPAMNNARATTDEDFLTTSPALIPDVLMPLQYEGRVVVAPKRLTSLWVDVEVPADVEVSAESEIKFEFELTSRNPEEKFNTGVGIILEIIGATLPEQKTLFTQWFHSDCLANYYRCGKWSDEHFKIIENFAKVAKKNGINMIFTPLVSPPLDNSYDTRDLQLADVTVKDGVYSFGWDKLDRWIEMADRVGIPYFEIGHLFTQGGAAYATKVMGTVDGEYKRLFSKDTPCDAPEYTKFLREMLSSFLAHMRKRGDDKRCYFHISDEPSDAQLETYKKAKETVADLLSGYVIMDALSHYEFYESGVVKKPVVILHHLDEFLVHDVKGLWAYNCCAPASGYSNRFLAMSLARNRSIALMLYKYDIEGFLHWGYNFYNNSGSSDCINPFLETDSGGIFPSGDAFSVYPADNGEALESMRLVTFAEALTDIEVFRLCESLYSRDEVIRVLEEEIGGEIVPSTYVNSAQKYQAIRDRINEMIKARISCG